MKNVSKFFSDLGNIFKYIYNFSTDEDISRLRVFIVWTLIALIPSISIYVTIKTWQVNIPGVEVAQSSGNGLVSLLLGTSILPILFFITNGLRGYHELFNISIEKFFKNFEKRSVTSLCTEYGNEEGMRKLRKVDLAKYISAFLLLEFIIIGWATGNYFLTGGTTTGLGLAGYVLDDLLMGAIVLILEGVYSIADGFIEAPKVYKMKPLFQNTNNNNNDPEEDPWTE